MKHNLQGEMVDIACYALGYCISQEILPNREYAYEVLVLKSRDIIYTLTDQRETGFTNKQHAKWFDHVVKAMFGLSNLNFRSAEYVANSLPN